MNYYCYIMDVNIFMNIILMERSRRIYYTASSVKCFFRFPEHRVCACVISPGSDLYIIAHEILETRAFIFAKMMIILHYSEQLIDTLYAGKNCNRETDDLSRAVLAKRFH